MTGGKVYLVGAGPGDPELLTLKALRVLRSAHVVLADRLVGDGIVGLAAPDALVIPVGKEPGLQEEIQRRILWLMLAHARRGRVVVRLKGGDPLVFGRGGEEWRHLAEHGIPVELVPGISSALAVPGLAGIPLTHRGLSGSFAVVAGHRADGPVDGWDRYARVDTLVVLMGVASRARIAADLVSAGRSAHDPVAFVERGSTPEERVIVATLGEVASGLTTVEAPAVMVVGQVVSLREGLAVPLTTRGSASPRVEAARDDTG